MSASVFAFPSRGKGPQPWSNDELAELYRVVDLLGRAGLAVATDMGMSDEGDPWFVFCRTDNEEVIAHFARIDGIFVAASIAVDETFRGANFRQIVDRMVSSQPLVMPRPNPGSKLFLHPAVMLTAFVATALAHSEKTQVLDWLHAVEAQWGHSKAALLSEVKHIKTGWLDTLQTLWKLPLHEDKLAHENAKEGQAFTLASLIAIALAALQPIAEKITAISHLVADELPGHSAYASQGGAGHAVLQVQDGSADGAAGPADDHGASSGRNGGHGGDDGTTPGGHKVVAATATTESETHQATVDRQAAADTAHAAAVSAVQKTAFADDSPHAAATAETQSDANGAFLLMQQKVAAMTQSSSAAETFSIHVDLSANTAQPISIQDVTSEALQLLNIHVTKTDLAANKTSTVDMGSGQSDPTVVSSSQVTTTPTETSSSSPAVVQAQPTDQTVDVVHVSGEAVILAISNFVTSEAHNISTPISLSSGLQQQLASYFGANSSLKVIFFESDNPMADVFSFSSDVVFVNEKDVSPSTHMSNGGGNLVLDVTGGTVTLVGVTTIEHSAAV